MNAIERMEEIGIAMLKHKEARDWVRDVTSDEQLEAISELIDAKIELARLEGKNG
jgi:hypothetical protein